MSDTEPTTTGLANELKLWKQQARKWEARFKQQRYQALSAKQALETERAQRGALISKSLSARLGQERAKRTALQAENDALRAELDLVLAKPLRDDSARHSAG